MTTAPRIYLNGRELSGSRSSSAPVLAPAVLTWGSDGAYEQPAPDNLKFTLLFRESMFDVPDLVKGAEIELIHPVGGRTIFAGRIRTLNAAPSTRVKGALEVTCNATGHKTEAENEYISTDWAAGLNRASQIGSALFAAGWWAYFPDNAQQSAAAKYNSIKLMTAIERYISRYRGRAYETSYRDSEGVLQRRLTIMEGTARAVAPDTLRAVPIGKWSKIYNTPMISGEPSALLDVPASNALQDPSWTQEADNAVTAVTLSTMALGEDGFTELTERNYQAPQATRDKYGTQTVSFETDLLNTADWQAAANAWMTNDSPWKMSGLTIHDTDQMATADLANLLASNTRFKTLVAVTGIMANRPDPGPSDLRSYLLGGSYEWTGKKWVLTLELERTITALAGTGDYWTCERVAASTNLDIRNATCATVGDTLTVGDFLFIGAP